MSASSTVSKNLDRILKIVDGKNVRIVAVTKYYDSSKIKEAYYAGLRDFAESRALEAVEKINELDDEIRSKSTYHFPICVRLHDFFIIWYLSWCDNILFSKHIVAHDPYLKTCMGT